MSTVNPYASPVTDEEPLLGIEPSNSGGCYREGKYVVVPNGRALLPRCVYCNARLKKAAIRSRPIVAHRFLPYLLQPRVVYGMCRSHSIRRFFSFALLLAPLLMLLAFLAVSAVVLPSNLFLDQSQLAREVLLGILLSFVVMPPIGVAIGWRFRVLVRHAAYDDEIWIANCGKRFLQSLPELALTNTEEKRNEQNEPERAETQ